MTSLFLFQFFFDEKKTKFVQFTIYNLLAI